MNGAVGKAPPILLKAAGNVRHLIAHLANEGDAVEEAECAEVLGAISKIDSLTPPEEASFWKNYSALVKSALPARVDALYYADRADVDTAEETNNPEIKKIIRQDATLRRIRKISIAAFTVTLLLFAYLSITESAMQRNRLVAEEYSNLSAGIVKGTTIEKTYQAVKDEPASNDQGGAGGPAKSQSQNFVQADKQTQLKTLVETREKELRALAGYNDNILRFLEFRWLGSEPSTQVGPVDNATSVTQQSINALVSKYLLPVFAALLGVTVYILRTASADMQALSFRAYNSGIYSNRLALGVVGGIAISWFSVTDTTGIVGSITPAALAFLVGYSVEVLYNILDSLVKALGANPKA